LHAVGYVTRHRVEFRVEFRVKLLDDISAYAIELWADMQMR